MKNGITILEQENGDILVLFPFSYFNKECPEKLVYKNRTYYAGMLEIIPEWGISHYCSARSYSLEESKSCNNSSVLNRAGFGGMI